MNYVFPPFSTFLFFELMHDYVKIWEIHLGLGVGVVTSGGTSICLPDLKVMALTFFGFCTVCEGNLS